MKLVYQALAERLRARNKSTDCRAVHEAAAIELAKKYLPGKSECDQLTLSFDHSMRQHCREEFTVIAGKDFGDKHWTEWHFTVHPLLTEPFQIVVERDGPRHESFLDHEGDYAEVLERVLRKGLLAHVVPGVDGADDGPPCMAEVPRYLCSQTKGHAHQHVAAGEDDRVIAVWVD